MASTISTPGMIGRFGKCPAKKGSLIVTFLIATMRSLRFRSMTRSINRNGNRCGRMRQISLMSSVVFTNSGASTSGCAVSVILGLSGATIILYRFAQAFFAAIQKGLMSKKSQVEKARATADSESEMANRLRYFAERQNEVTETIRQLVEIESPSDNKQAVDRLSSMLAGRYESLGGHAKFHRAQDFGDHLQVDFRGQRGGKPVLLLGHTDTVYSLGTLAHMPCRIADGRLWGPGVLDMKSGIALMLQPSYGLRGAVKTARKGVGEYTLKITGRAAHSGLDFEKGQSAVIELAKQIIEISKLVDLKRGWTLNVGVVQGGTRTNVIPAEATAFVDVRVTRMKDAAVIDRKLRFLKPFNRECKLEFVGGVNRPPLERRQGVVALYKKAFDIAKQLGWKLQEAAVGGGSDGNFTAALGIPTLDGLGGVGEGAHATHESIVLSELPKRAALLAGLIETA